MSHPRADAYALLALLEALQQVQAPLPPPATLDPALGVQPPQLPPLPPTRPPTVGRRRHG